jgi:PAS domain S-box-containing protein
LHLAVLRDVTERKAVESELARKSELLQTIFDNMPCMFNVLGPGVDPLMVNREWTRVLGWTPQDLGRGDILDLLYPDHDERRRTREFIQASDRSWRDFRLRARDGRMIDTSWANFRLSDGTMIGIGQDVTERKRAEEEREALSRRLVSVQEEERRTIARELHDEIGQILTGLRLMLEWTSQKTGLELAEIKDLAAQISERVKDLSLNLRPPMLDDLGLVPTLLWHFERYRAQTGIHVRFHHRGVGAPRQPGAGEITVFRIVQEALTNVARHAGVAEVTVELWAESGSMWLRVEDAGRGFDPAALGALSSGLSGMRERALLTGGSLAIESRPGEGTRLLARLPLVAADTVTAGE